MSNQKITQLNKILDQELVRGDLIPLVDVTATEISSTGETVAMRIGDLAQIIVSGSTDYYPKNFKFKTSNGLYFDQSFIPYSDRNLMCYSTINKVGTKFSLVTRAFFPSTFTTESAARSIFGIGYDVENMVSSGQSAYIGVEGYDLIGLVDDGITEKKIVFDNFFSDYNNSVVYTALTRDSYGTLNLFLNGMCVGTLSGSATQITGSYISMGNGTSNLPNIDCTIYEAHLFNDALSPSEIKSIFYGGVKNSHRALVSSYIPETLSKEPSQWLDSKNSNHLLLPVSGAYVTKPRNKFNLIFKNDGVSGFLGNGTQRDVLPENYVLTDAFVYSKSPVLLSLGSSSGSAKYGSEKIYSCNNNRVELTSASYNRNILQLSEFGVAHTDRSIYVYYSSSAAPCTFSFQGYIAEYGPVLYTP